MDTEKRLRQFYGAGPFLTTALAHLERAKTHDELVAAYLNASAADAHEAGTVEFDWLESLRNRSNHIPFLAHVSRDTEEFQQLIDRYAVVTRDLAALRSVWSQHESFAGGSIYVFSWSASGGGG